MYVNCVVRDIYLMYSMPVWCWSASNLWLICRNTPWTCVLHSTHACNSLNRENVNFLFQYASVAYAWFCCIRLTVCLSVASHQKCQFDLIWPNWPASLCHVTADGLKDKRLNRLLRVATWKKSHQMGTLLKNEVEAQTLLNVFVRAFINIMQYPAP